MLADTLERYQEQEKSLISDFKGLCHEDCRDVIGADGLVHWVDRSSPRKYALVKYSYCSIYGAFQALQNC
jgi:hypothetical protein